MKDQYFGDIIDYKKYSLIKLLTGNGKLKTTICWMMTNNDDGSKGGKTGYLKQPEIWRDYDPIIFEHLKKSLLGRKVRKVQVIQKGNILRNCSFFNEILRDSSESRATYFEKFFKLAKGSDLVFFDPDNGLSVKSVKIGNKGSSKYISRAEIETAYTAGYSVLIYQHFPRVCPSKFISDSIKTFTSFNFVKHIISLKIANVVFLLLPQKLHEHQLFANIENITSIWKDLVQIKIFEVAKKKITPPKE